MTPSPNSFAHNVGVSSGIATSAAVTLWVFRCITTHQIAVPDDTVAVILSGYFMPIGIAIRDLVLSWIRRETPAVPTTGETK